MNNWFSKVHLAILTGITLLSTASTAVIAEDSITQNKLTKIVFEYPQKNALAGGDTEGANSLEGFAALENIWPENAYGLVEIPVCFESSLSTIFGLPRQTEVVQQAVANTWEKYSRVRFTGWKRCGFFDEKQGVRIKIDSGERPHVKALGKALDTMKSGVVMNFHPKDSGFIPLGANIPACSNIEGDACVSAIAVHLFGQVLGFASEHKRPGAWDCESGLDNFPADVLVGVSEDRDSVLNRCNYSNFMNNGQLSEMDLAMLVGFYDRVPLQLDDFVTIPMVDFFGFEVAVVLREVHKDFLYRIHLIDSNNPVPSLVVATFDGQELRLPYLLRMLAPKGPASNYWRFQLLKNISLRYDSETGNVYVN